jgi:hypothetical protein
MVVEQAETHLRVAEPIEEEEEDTDLMYTVVNHFQSASSSGENCTFISVS